MSNPVVQAFFVGRAIAEVLSERTERALTDVLSEWGKLEAEARENLRQFTDEVIERANRAAQAAETGVYTTQYANGEAPGDIQANIDDLRAEMATLRSELQRYRSGNSAE